jgi:hypothetical protein
MRARRARRGVTKSIVSAIKIDGHDLQWAKPLEEGGFAGRLRFCQSLAATA